LKLVDLTKRFGQVTAVDKVNIEVKDTEFMVLLGPSGCGKSTTLRCVAGLETVSEGEIFIGEDLVNDLPPKDRNIAMVFQSYALYPHMSVFDNIAFPLKLRHVPKNEIKKRVEEAAELLRISHLLDRRPYQLSGGESQRTALGRAIIREPSMFLMDEPLSNLDAQLRVHMRVELKRLQKALKTTTIYVTHDQVEAMTMGDRVAVMNQGKLEGVGTPDDVYHRPATKFMGSFVGSPPLNLIHCTLTEKNGKAFLDASDFALPIPNVIVTEIQQKATSSELILGIRPENLSLYVKPASKNCIKASVYAVEPLGAFDVIDFKVGNVLLKASSSEELGLSVGSDIWFSVDIDKINIFDKKSERFIL